MFLVQAKADPFFYAARSNNVPELQKHIIAGVGKDSVDDEVRICVGY
jgi:hypothetical protein